MRRLSSLFLLPALLLVSCGNPTRVDRIPVPPQIELLSPEPGAIFRQDLDDLLLQARVVDSYDGPEDLEVSWQIDEQEPVGVSLDSEDLASLLLSSQDLELGLHVATLLAVDSDGASASASVGFEVQGPLGTPTATITSPEDGASFDLGELVTLIGEGADATTAPDELVFSWTSSLGGLLEGSLSADGQSVLPTTDLAAGSHTITLEVVDADGEVGSDSIVVHVAEPIVEAEPGDLVFSEMMVNPQAVADEVGEWVELYNTSGSPIDVGGYTFRDDDVDSWVLEGPLVVEGHDFLVLCADLDPSVNGGVPCDGWFLRDPQGAGLALANNPDELVLARPDGTEIDWLHYDDSWWEAGIATGVHPDHLDGSDNDDPAHWCLQSTVVLSSGEPGTPGQANDPC